MNKKNLFFVIALGILAAGITGVGISQALIDNSDKQAVDSNSQTKVNVPAGCSQKGQCAHCGESGGCQCQGGCGCGNK